MKGNRQGSLSRSITRRSAAVQKLNCCAFFSFRRFAARSRIIVPPAAPDSPPGTGSRSQPGCPHRREFPGWRRPRWGDPIPSGAPKPAAPSPTAEPADRPALNRAACPAGSAAPSPARHSRRGSGGNPPWRSARPDSPRRRFGGGAGYAAGQLPAFGSSQRRVADALPRSAVPVGGGFLRRQ